MRTPRSPSPPPATGRGWLARLAPGVGRLAGRRRAPANLWVRCAETAEMVYRPDLEAAQWVTPSGFHMRIGAGLRFAYTFDDSRFEALAAPRTADDPLNFTYPKSYRQSLVSARRATGEAEAMSAAFGHIGGVPAVVVVQNFAFVAGTLGVAAGETFVAAAEEAVRRGAAFIVFTAAAGARMQEGALALMQLARTTLAVERLRRARLPYVVVLTDPTLGGVTASYAMLGDVQLVEHGAVVGFTGRRVIEQTIRKTLPDHYQTADMQVERGMAERVVKRPELPRVLGALLRTLMIGRERRPAA